MASGDDASFTHIPGNFSFTGSLALAIDARTNWIPVHFASLHALVTEVNSNKPIGQGDWNGLTVAGRALVAVNIPITFSYRSPNSSDATCMPRS